MPGARAAALDLDAVLAELGSFGRYQVLTYCYMFLPIAFSAIYNSQYIFNAAAVDYRCQVPECEASPPQWVPNGWGVWALPESGGRCERLRPLAPECAPDAFHANDTVRCDAWLYENDNSIVATFGLACQEWKRTLVGTLHSAGMFAALPLTGYISDKYGRRLALVLTAVAPGVVGLVRSFSTGYVMYVILEFIEPVVGSGVYSTGFIIAVEMVGLNRRVLGGNLIACFFALGQVLTALAAWAFPYWRTLTQVIYAPSLLFVFYYFLIEETVRWLLSQGNKKEAARIIFKAAAVNKRKLSPETIKMLSEDPASPLPEEKVKHVQENPQVEKSLISQVLRSKLIMTRLVICSFWWITTALTYYGLSINSVSLAGDMYVNYILTSLVEIPGYAVSVLTLDRYGRKASIMAAFWICGVSLVAMPFIPSSVQWLQTTLNMVGKLSISMAFSSIYIYTSELFPTNARHSLLGFCSMVGRVGSLLAPQTPLLMSVLESLPYLIFGVMAAVSGALMLLTPETLGERLPDTMAQAEGIADKRRASAGHAA